MRVVLSVQHSIENRIESTTSLLMNSLSMIPNQLLCIYHNSRKCPQVALCTQDMGASPLFAFFWSLCVKRFEMEEQAKSQATGLSLYSPGQLKSNVFKHLEFIGTLPRNLPRHANHLRRRYDSLNSVKQRSICFGVQISRVDVGEAKKTS